MEIVNGFGSFASILSFIISIWVAYEVRNLGIFYKRHLLLPNYVRGLSTHIRNAKRALIAKRSDEFIGILRKCDAIVERLQSYSDAKLVSRIQESRKSIKVILDGKAMSVFANGPNAIGELEAIIESARAFVSEDKWTRTT